MNLLPTIARALHHAAYLISDTACLIDTIAYRIHDPDLEHIQFEVTTTATGSTVLLFVRAVLRRCRRSY